MSEARDLAIKLFGKTIALPATVEEGVDDKDHQNKEETTTTSKDREEESPKSEDKKEPDDTQKPSSDDEATESGKNSNPEEEQNDSSNSQEKNDLNNPEDKVLKKPDKILPCPRCNSLDTKFCYFNNYNVNQPRHFCKNCQRYWTAGGTMRNVPVGAGRRKNKSSIASHYRHLTVSDATMLAIPEHIHHPHSNPNGTVLSFGSDPPLYECIASALSLTDKTMMNCHRNGIHHREEQMEEQSCGSSVTAANSNEEGIGANLNEPGIRNCQGFAPPIPYLNGSPWPFPYMPPNMSASAFPMPFYPAAAYWGCNPWSLPWLSPVTSGPSKSIPSATTLGKHTREGDVDPTNSVSETGDERSRLWIPKTLRIADPEEAAKSSIWATMGFKSDKSDTTSTGPGFFKAFEKKGELRADLTDASQALHANPAALSRAIRFQESS